jgi:protein RecA
MANKKPEKETIAELLKRIRKEFGPESVSTIDSAPLMNVEVIPTGSYSVNKALGVGGLPRGRIVEIFGPEASGKCHAKGTKIFMYDGSFKKVEDLCIGDLVMGIDSNSREINGLGTGRGKMYKIIPSFGKEDSFVVNEEHILSLIRTNGDGYKLGGRIVNISVKDYLKKSNNFKTYHHLYRVGVDFKQQKNKRKLLIDPYFLGIWLGDGTSESTEITTADKEVVDFINSYAKQLDLYVTVADQGVDNKSKTYRINTKKHGGSLISRNNTLLNSLKAYDLIKNKHIPQDYLFASRDNRLKLLAGLIDSDGYNCETAVTFSNTNRILAEQTQFLARTLGYFSCLSTGTYIRPKDGKRMEDIRVRIGGELADLPLRLSRKIPRKKHTSNNSLYTGFTIKEMPKDIFYGFTLNGDSLYLLDSFIVNHNTTLALSVIAEAQKKKGICVYIDAENVLDRDRVEALGVNLKELILNQPSSAEEALNLLVRFIESASVDVIVVDSVAALVPKSELEGAVGESLIGLQARMMGQTMRKIAAITKKTKTLVIFINQIRMKVGMTGYGGNPEIRPGGRALGFYASVILDVRKTGNGNIKDGEVPVGNTVRVKVAKNKVGPPLRVAEFGMLYDKGISYEFDVFSVAVREEVIKKEGRTFFLDDEKLGTSAKMAMETFKANPELLKKVITILEVPRIKKPIEPDEEAIEQDE